MGELPADSALGIIIPAYDPDLVTLERYIESVRKTVGPDTIRVEIDAPRREHVTRLTDIADEVNVSVARRGKGSAIMDGFDSLDSDVLAFADADGAVSERSLARVIRQVRDGNTDVSIGSRRHPDSRIVAHQTVVRRLLGDVFAFAAERLLPTQCTDYQCGAKAVRADAWDVIGHHCYEPGFAWDLEFVSVAGSLGYSVVEVPVEWKDHPKSTVDPIATPFELATALLDVKRRTDAIETSPRYRDVSTTHNSRLLRRGGDGG